MELFGWDSLSIFFVAVIIAIYIPAFILSTIFTFFVSLFQKIEEKVTVDIFPCPYVTPLDRNITYLNEWLIENHYIIGPFMIFASLYDVVFLFDIVRVLRQI